MSSRRKTPKNVKPPWAGKSGPGYEFDADGDLRWFVSASILAGRERLAKADDVVPKMTDDDDESGT